jgi:branched-chain amino acid aminotransferase
VACTTIANVFAVVGDKLVTPPVADGVMAGVTRGLVLERAPAAGLAVAERSLTVEELFGADHVFVTNSVRLASAVASLDGKRLEPGSDEGFAALLGAVAERIEGECGFDPLRRKVARRLSTSPRAC